MSVREYIGARYVPLIYGEWDVTKEYEPLTIVTNQGSSYTSKQYVPVGVSLSNTDYWVLTGDFNGQTAALGNRVTNLENDSETMNTTITQLTTTTDSLSQDITSLQTSQAEQDNKIEALENDAESNKITVIIGDSYSDPADNALRNVTSWSTYYSQLYQGTVKNYAKGGSGYIHNAGSIDSFKVQVEKAVADTSFDNQMVEKVIIYGGLNDALDTTQNPGGCQTELLSCISTIHDNMPNAQIVVALNWWCRTFTKDALKLMEFLQSTANDNLATFFYEPTWCLFNYDSTSVFFSDNAHPNNLGMKVIAETFFYMTRTSRVISHPMVFNQNCFLAPIVEINGAAASFTLKTYRDSSLYYDGLRIHGSFSGTITANNVTANSQWIIITLPIATNITNYLPSSTMIPINFYNAASSSTKINGTGYFQNGKLVLRLDRLFDNWTAGNIDFSIECTFEGFIL